MRRHDYIHSDPSIVVGKPVIRGARLSVEFLLGLMAEGWTEQQILENYPHLSREALRALLPSLRNVRGMNWSMPSAAGQRFEG